MTAIILINWNGADDTLACLNSLLKADGDFFVVVVDNASTDDSVLRLNDFAQQYCDKIRIDILALDDNYGFAVGNNKGVQYAMQFAPSSIMLLNNDTEVDPHFLQELQKFSTEHPEYRVLTPRINYFHDKNLIWECGGLIKIGEHKKYYGDKSGTLLDGIDYFPITFISGCAMYFYPELLDIDNNIFTDRFFFGEEDFDFSLRMKKKGVKMACVPTSQIYHKVGRARKKMSTNVGKYYMYYLNRLILLRIHYPKFVYVFMKFLYMINAFRYFQSVNHSLTLSIKMLKRLNREAKTKYGVNRADFQALMIDNNYFKNN